MTLGPERHLTLAEVMERQKTHWLRRAEVPLEHHVSILLPTKRWSEAGFACYAGPALRRPGEPTRVSRPDRYWAVAANGGRLLVYALCAAAPYAEDLPAEPQVVPAPQGSIAELKEQLAEIGELAGLLAPRFFDGQPGDQERRRELMALLQAQLPGRLWDWQQGLTGDFLGWLTA